MKTQQKNLKVWGGGGDRAKLGHFCTLEVFKREGIHVQNKPKNVTVHGKTYSNDFLFLSRIPFTTVCKLFEKNLHPFKWLGHPFARNTTSLERLGHPFARNTNSFEWRGHPFTRNTNLFKRLGQSFAWNTNSFEQLDYPFAQNTNLFKQLDYLFAGNSNSFERIGHLFAGNTILLDQIHNCNNYSGIGRIFSFTFLHQLSGITFFVS